MSPEKAWSKRLADVTGYSLMELEPCAEALNAWKTTANEKGFSLAKKKYFNVNNNY